MVYRGVSARFTWIDHTVLFKHTARKSSLYSAHQWIAGCRLGSGNTMLPGGVRRSGVVSQFISSAGRVRSNLLKRELLRSTRGQAWKTNPPYVALTASDAGNRGTWKEAERRAGEAQFHRDPQDWTFVVSGTRYADDFLLELVGTKQKPWEIKQSPNAFLRAVEARTQWWTLVTQPWAKRLDSWGMKSTSSRADDKHLTRESTLHQQLDSCSRKREKTLLILRYMRKEKPIHLAQRVTSL